MTHVVCIAALGFAAAAGGYGSPAEALMPIRYVLLALACFAASALGIRTGCRGALYVGIAMAAAFGAQAAVQLGARSGHAPAIMGTVLIQVSSALAAVLAVLAASVSGIERKVASGARAAIAAGSAAGFGALLVTASALGRFPDFSAAAPSTPVLILAGTSLALLYPVLTRLRAAGQSSGVMTLSLGLFVFYASALSPLAAVIPEWNDGITGLALALPLLLDCAAAALIPGAVLMQGLAAAVPAPSADSSDAARRDALTGLFNRRVLDTLGPKLFADSHQMERPLSLLLLDIDHFKRINDLYGHPAGDEVLRQFGSIIAAQVRATDLVARYGGEEFAAVLPGAPLSPALRLGERIRAAIEAEEFDLGNGQSIHITTSVGAATAFPGEVADYRELTAIADRNLYRAKRAGRNRVTSTPLDEESEED